ncbi:hypothetical protein D9M71_714170 [compost metagenome]
MMVATSNSMSSVLADCTTLPLTLVCSSRPLPPAGSSSAVTRSGPNAPVSSKFLPTVHCGDLNWYSRTEPSLNSA